MSQEVYAIGSAVLLDGVIPAKITAIFIREGHVAYECVYWNERERVEVVVGSWEVQPDSDQSRTMRINQVL